MKRHIQKSWLCCQKQDHAAARRDGAESHQGRSGGRVVGADEELNPWMRARLRACSYQARQAGRQISARALCSGSCRRALRSSRQLEEQGGFTLSYVSSLCHRYPHEDYILWVSSVARVTVARRRRGCNWWFAAFGDPVLLEGPRTESWSHRTVRIPARRRSFGPTLHLRVRAIISRVLLKLLANLQADGCNLVGTIFEGLQETHSLFLLRMSTSF